MSLDSHIDTRRSLAPAATIVRDAHGTPYVSSFQASTEFLGRGLFGYRFRPLSQRGVELCYIEVDKGHDTFVISKKITRVYYVLAGHGYFTIDGRRYDVDLGLLVEIPPGVEYSYSGSMTLLMVSSPRWFDGNDTHTRWNADVIGRNPAPRLEHVASWTTRLANRAVLGRSPLAVYLRLSRRLWNALPASLRCGPAAQAYAGHVHALARHHSIRGHVVTTWFLRNRPMLELIRRLVGGGDAADDFRVAILGCSTGAEAYSVAWRIRSARPDLKLVLNAVDISKHAIDAARRGIYTLTTPQQTPAPLFERMTPSEMQEFFDRVDGAVSVKDWIRSGIRWHVGDAGDSSIVDTLGAHDLVLANNFLCYMEGREAERCLRNLARLVAPDGHLLVSGIDVEIRSRVAADLAWQPVEELLEDIHDGDPSVRVDWPFDYAALEPLDKRRPDRKIRYAAAFRVGGRGPRR